MSDLTAPEWERLMDAVVEQADYSPGANMAPGSGTEGGDPNGIRYSDLGPLAFVLNEAIDACVVRGADREALLNALAQAAEATREQVDAVLEDRLKCPDPKLIQSFGEATSIDVDILMDAAEKGGCKGFGSSIPPGY